MKLAHTVGGSYDALGVRSHGKLSLWRDLDPRELDDYLHYLVWKSYGKNRGVLQLFSPLRLRIEKIREEDHASISS